jgi:hypothetical protein
MRRGSARAFRLEKIIFARPSSLVSLSCDDLQKCIH